METNELFSTKDKLILVMIAAAAAARLLPHMPNFTPIGAMALFGGTYIANKRWAIVAPLCAMLLSDVALQLRDGNGFHSSMPFVYAAFIIIAMIGFLVRKSVQRPTIMVASLVGSIIFFLITNFGTWLTQDLYEHTFSGLMNCYIMAVPFFRGTVMGDLFYNLLLFGSFALIKWRFPKLASN